MNYTYMLRCSDGTFYTGWTNNLEKRIACHNAGKGAKYTRVRLPVELAYFEQFQTKEEAMRREYELKQIGRSRKLKLAQGFLREQQEAGLQKPYREAEILQGDGNIIGERK